GKRYVDEMSGAKQAHSFSTIFIYDDAAWMESSTHLISLYVYTLTTEINAS
ncbi:hypothetical protein ACJX0J_033471, partial [Zea mays]